MRARERRPDSDVREKKNLISPFAASYFGAGMAGDNYMVAGLPS